MSVIHNPIQRGIVIKNLKKESTDRGTGHKPRILACIYKNEKGILVEDIHSIDSQEGVKRFFGFLSWIAKTETEILVRPV